MERLIQNMGMNIGESDPHILADIERTLSMKPGSLRRNTMGRILVSGLPLMHEMHYQLSWHWWGHKLRVWQLSVPDTEWDLSFEAREDIPGPDPVTIAIIEPGRTSVMGLFELEKTVYHPKKDINHEIIEYTLTRRWFSK